VLDKSRLSFLLAAAVFAMATPDAIRATPTTPAPPPPTSSTPAGDPGYADFADLADSAPLVATVKLARQNRVDPDRAGQVRAGWARLYVEAQTIALLVGERPIGSRLAYLVDVPLDARGKVPKLTGRTMFIFAREVAAQPAEVQLVAPDAQIEVSAPREARLRQVLADLHAPDAPARITAVREALFVPGTLAGAGETQISLATGKGMPASISVTHQPGQPTVWAVSFGEVFDVSGKPPPRDTLPWYRLACFLPPSLPGSTSIPDGDRGQAAADYRLVLAQLGACGRTRS
jgi:hypothetical protein